MAKEMSARKYIVIATTTTYCLIMAGITIITIFDVSKLNILLALFAGFSGGYTLQNEWYFKREDRIIEPKGEVK